MTDATRSGEVGVSDFYGFRQGEPVSYHQPPMGQVRFRPLYGWVIGRASQDGHLMVKFLTRQGQDVDMQCEASRLQSEERVAPERLSVRTSVPAERLDDTGRILTDMLAAIEQLPIKAPSMFLDGPEAKWAAQRLNLPAERVERIEIKLTPARDTAE